MIRVGVVLGAGGVVGQAYHAGVLSVLHGDHGFDPAGADVLVGTSAGSITASLVRLGVGTQDLAAWATRAPLSEEGPPLVRDLAAHPIPELEPFYPTAVLRRRPDLPGPSMIGRAVVRPWQFRPLAAGLALLAPGRFDIEEQLAAITGLERAPWPDRDLWICAVRRRDGRRIVFGRPGSPVAPIHKAVAASCAVPGYFAPVTIGEHTYVDGGAHSPTNAAVLARRELDLVVVVSPMSGPSTARLSLYSAARRHAARLLEREVRSLERAGIRTLVIAPDVASQRVMGDDLMAHRRLDSVVDQARRSTRTALRARAVRPAIQLLAAAAP